MTKIALSLKNKYATHTLIGDVCHIHDFESNLLKFLL